MKEAEIRPEYLLQRYLELSAEDATRCFLDGKRNAIPCVACGAAEARAEFIKHSFAYASCGACGTMYQSPRPEIAAFEQFYRDSASSRYWAEEFFPAVAEARRNSIFRPRVERLAALCAAKSITVERLVDVGAGFGIFLDEWRKCFPETELLAVEPGSKLAQICRTQGFEVVEDVVENVAGHDGEADLVVCFEVLEHVYDPVNFIRILSRLVKPGGHVFVSTLSVDGYDIQTLWENSNSIFPPHHINFLSQRGFERAFARAGLINADISTPGRLDVDIVRNSYKREPAILKDNHFARLLVNDAERGAAFQSFLAENRLSSHTWVLAQKPAV
jgi:SAM-dependent methyltransferase